MQTQWNEWLAAERAAGRGGVVLAEASIVRGKAYQLVLNIPGDLTGSAFTAALYEGPGADLPPLAEFTETLGAFDPVSGVTPLTLALPATATDSELPPDGNFDGVEEVVFKLDFTPAGGSTALRAQGLVIPVVE